MNRRATWRRADVVAPAGAASIALLLAYYLLLTPATTLARLVSASSASPVYLPVLALLVVVSSGLIGANVAIFTLLTRARLATSAPTGSVVAGIVGAFGVGCPACGAYLLSLLGVSAGLAVLPFGGLEIWALASLLMAATLARSWRNLVMACHDDEAGCPMLPGVSQTDRRGPGGDGHSFGGADLGRRHLRLTHRCRVPRWRTLIPRARAAARI